MALTIGTLLAKAGLEIDSGSFRSLDSLLASTKTKLSGLTDAKVGLNVDSGSFQALDTAIVNAKTNLKDLSTESQLAISATLTAVPVAIAAIAGAGLSVASNFEDASTTLTTLYGDVDTAKAKFQDLSAFAAQTPFEFPELLDATVKLKAYGIEAGDYLKILGDTASGMGKSLNDTVEALADAQTGEFERLKEFGIKALEITKKNAEQLGVSAEEAGKTALMYTDKYGKQQVEVVDRNNREMITSTITGIWNEKYAGAMEQRSKTMSGMLSTLKDNMSMALADLVGFDMQTMEVQALSLMGVISSLVGVGIGLTGWLSGVSEPVQTFITVVGVAVGAISLLSAGFVAYGAILPMVTTAQTALGVSLTAALWPVAAGVAALGLLAAGLYVLEEKTGLVSAGFQVFKDVLTITFDAISRAVDWLVTGIKSAAEMIYNYLSNLIPPSLSSALSAIGGTISSIFGDISGKVHTSAENIRTDNANIKTSTQEVGTQAAATSTDVSGAGSAISSVFGNIGISAGNMGAQVATAGTNTQASFAATGTSATNMGTQVGTAGSNIQLSLSQIGIAAGNMGVQTAAAGTQSINALNSIGSTSTSVGSQVTTATGNMYAGFVQTQTGAQMAAGGITGLTPAVSSLSSAVGSATSVNQSYAASFVDISNMASAAASAAISAASKIGAAIKTSAAQVGNVAALAGKWDTRTKLGTTSSGGSGTGESKVKVVAAKSTTTTTNNTTINVNTKQSSGNVISQAKRAAGK